MEKWRSAQCTLYEYIHQGLVDPTVNLENIITTKSTLNQSLFDNATGASSLMVIFFVKNRSKRSALEQLKDTVNLPSGLCKIDAVSYDWDF